MGQNVLKTIITSLCVFCFGACATAPPITGTYGARLPAASSPGRIIHLTLSDDKRVDMSTDYLNDQPAVTETGTWESLKGGEISVAITGRDDQMYQKPEAMTFRINGDRKARSTAPPEPTKSYCFDIVPKSFAVPERRFRPMQVDSPAKIRNIAIAGHNATGKTTLASALLFTSGAAPRFGKVEDGNTITDFDPEESERGISIGLAVCYAPWKQHKLNFIDSPGYGIFFSETRAALRAADAALLCVSGVAGVEVNTEKVWDATTDLELPVIIHLNKMDRERADLDRSLDSLHKVFGRQVIPIQLPIGSEKDFVGVIDLVTSKAYRFERDGSGKGKEIPIPADLQTEAEDVGPAVDVLARLPNGAPVAAREGRLLATAFHPELTQDSRMQRYFVACVDGR